MQASLFDHLEPAAVQRAESLPLFAAPDRLARKPRCSEEKGFSVIRSVSHAVARPYIQPNSPTAYFRVVFDLDWHDDRHPLKDLPVRFLNDQHAWQSELGVPPPSWAAISPGRNSAHIGYELSTPVGRHEHARAKPQQYLAAIEAAMADKLGADPGFSGALCKNPLHTQWDFFVGHSVGRELNELSEYVELTKAKARKFNREPRGEVGRNVYLFDEVRFWAYDHVEEFRGVGFDRWQAAVVRQAEVLNAAGFEHLPALAGRMLLSLSECRAVGKSVARWTWTHHGQRVLTDAFRELQAWRGKRGAAVAAAVKRDRREEAILAAIAELTARSVLPTMGKVAEMVGCSKQALSKHYRALFQGTAQ